MQFMAGILEDLAGQVFHTGISQHGPDFAHTGPVVPDRIGAARYKQHRQVFVQRLDPFSAIHMVDGRQHLPIAAHREGKRAQRVGIIGTHHRLVPGQPGVGGFGVRNLFAVAAHIGPDHKARNRLGAFQRRQNGGHALADHIQHTGARRAGKNQSPDGIRPALGIPAGVKAAHAVPIEKDRHPGEFFVQPGIHGVQILQQIKASAGHTVMAVFPGFCALAMSQMVIACQHNTMGGIKFGHRLIAAHILAHTMAELQYRPHRNVLPGIHQPGNGVFGIG